MFSKFINNYVNKLCSKIDYGSLKLKFRNKDYYFQGQNNGPKIEMKIHSTSMLWDLYLRGSVGLGEAYINRKFEVNNLSEFLEFGALNGLAFDDEMDGSFFFVLFPSLISSKPKILLNKVKKIFILTMTLEISFIQLG